MRFVILIAVGALLSGCVSLRPTSYSEGLTIDLQRVTFSGNSHTSKENASMYVQAGAVEFCFNQKKLAVVTQPEDKSTSSTSFRSSAYTTPTYYSPQTRTSYGGHTTVTTYPVTKTFPSMAVYYMCVERLYGDGIKRATELSAGTVHSFSKDFLGGLLVNEADTNAGLHNGDVILGMGSTRITSHYDWQLALSRARGKSIEAQVIRGGKVIHINFKLYDHSAELLGDNLLKLGTLCKSFEKGNSEIPVVCQHDRKRWRAHLAPYIRDIGFQDSLIANFHLVSVRDGLPSEAE